MTLPKVSSTIPEGRRNRVTNIGRGVAFVTLVAGVTHKIHYTAGFRLDH